MSDTTVSNVKPHESTVDDYDDGLDEAYASAAPVQPRPSRSRKRYEDYAEDDPEVDYDGIDDDGDEVAVVSVSRGRALTLSLSVVLLLAIFGVAIWLFLSRSTTSAPPTGPIVGVPVITGFDPDTQKEDQKPAIGSYAPDFMWQENGKTVSLSSFRGKLPVFVNFWGTWCPPCRAEMPEMQTAYNKHFGQIEVIGVSMAPKDTASMVLNFVNLYKYNWKFLHDGDLKIAGRYQVAAVPSSYFIGTDGIIKAVQVGGMNGPIMESYISQVIAH